MVFGLISSLLDGCARPFTIMTAPGAKFWPLTINESEEMPAVVMTTAGDDAGGSFNRGAASNQLEPTLASK